MPVTEFAILSLRHGHDRLELLETLMQCQELQDDWMLQNQPHSLEPEANFSTMYFDDDAHAPSLLITAPWDSTEAHAQWIQCSENQTCNSKLAEYIVPGCDSVLLFHLEPAGAQAQIRGAFFSKGTFNVCRISTDSHQRHSLQQAYRSLERHVVATGVASELWAGWKMETSAGVHDLVVFWSDNVSSDHLDHLMSLSDNKRHHRFTHVVYLDRSSRPT